MRERRSHRAGLSLRIRVFGSAAAALGLLHPIPAWSAGPEESSDASMSRGTRFAVVGYTYVLLRERGQRQTLIDHLNRDKLDHVLILGDADLWDPEVAEQYRTGLAAPVWFAPGNHENQDDERVLTEQHDSYLSNVGYDRKTLVLGDANFIIVNTGEDVVALNAYLAKAFQEIDPNQPTVVFGHHRIWDDNRFSPFPRGQFKSYRFQELLPEFVKTVDLMLAGNSARIYFGTYGTSDPNNENVVYWCDVLEGVRGCSVGMKGPWQMSYVVAEVLDGEILLAPRAYPLDRTAPPRHPRAIDRTAWSYRLSYVLRKESFWAALVLGFVTGAGSLVFFRRWLSRRSPR